MSESRPSECSRQAKRFCIRRSWTPFPVLREMSSDPVLVLIVHYFEKCAGVLGKHFSTKAKDLLATGADINQTFVFANPKNLPNVLCQLAESFLAVPERFLCTLPLGHIAVHATIPMSLPSGPNTGIPLLSSITTCPFLCRFSLIRPENRRPLAAISAKIALTR